MAQPALCHLHDLNESVDIAGLCEASNMGLPSSSTPTYVAGNRRASIDRPDCGDHHTEGVALWTQPPLTAFSGVPFDRRSVEVKTGNRQRSFAGQFNRRGFLEAAVFLHNSA